MFIELDDSVTCKAKDAAVEESYHSTIWVWINWNDFYQMF